MKIAMLSWESMHSIAVGGIAPHVSELSTALNRRGHEVHVFTRRGDGQRRYDCVDGIHYHRCPYESHSDFVTSMARMSGSFVWHLGEVEHGHGERFDIVHGHDWVITKALSQIKNEWRRPVVFTMHSTEFGRCGNELFWHGQSRTIRDLEWEGTYVADRVICVSESLRKEVMWLYTVPSDKAFAIYNGVDVSRFDTDVDVHAVRRSYSVRADEPCVFFAGRMAWQKGPDLLIEAIPRVLRDHPRTKFVFAGDGEMRVGLESRVAALGAGPATRFLGYRKGADLVNLFKSADIVCVPSRNEPFGIVILEAWSATKPVVATRTGGPGEFVRHQHTGWTVPLDIESIGDGVAAVLADVEHARRMGENGRREAETRFSWDTIAQQTEAVYLSVGAWQKGGALHPAVERMEETTMARQQFGKGGRTNGSSARKPTRADATAPDPKATIKKTRSAGPTAPVNVEPTTEEIRKRAYEIFLGRNGAPGDPAADWLQAERELREQLRMRKKL